MKFKYKYESIKKVKILLEKKVQKEINVIDIEIQRLDDAIVGLVEDKNDERERVMGKKRLTGNDLKLFTDFDLYINKKITELEERREQVKKLREKKFEELKEKSKETKIFEKLKENHHEEYIKEENKIDQSFTDEIATNQFYHGS